LIDGLQKNETTLINSTIEDFTKAIDQISLARGEIGSKMAQIQRAIGTQENIKVDGISTISQIEDADSVKVFSDLARDRTVLQAAIATSQKLINENPTDTFFK
jgi:flagellin-like hook-associated protein FlgL